jgi:Glycosyl hydrolase family 99
MKCSTILLLIVGIVTCSLSFSCRNTNQLKNQSGVNNSDEFTVRVLDPKPVEKTNSQNVYVHYLPWFESPQTSGNGNWGQHWTMANQNPNIISSNGRRQIASYFYPLIGPYASSDRDVIDYHTLLMKYAGIDGVIVNWFGTHDVYDYPLIKRNTDSLFNRISRVGLKFGICYEDATLLSVKNKAGIDIIPAAKADFNFLKSQYFNSAAYIKISNQPLLLCFGPQAMQRQQDWQESFSGITVMPRLLSLWYQGASTGKMGSGEFAWVYADFPQDLQNFYEHQSPTLSTSFAAAYPGFKDFYKPGGWGNTMFIINHNGTATLQTTLNLAKSSKLSNLQLVTWNDFGEGTMIEPTLEFNYSLLETIQQYTGVSYTKKELQLIYKWYTLRKKYKSDSAVEQKLLQAYYYLVSLDVANASDIISSIP